METRFSRAVKPFDIPVAQTWENVITHWEILNEFDIKLFIEIGVYFGGLTSMILPRLDYVKDFHYLGFEKVDNVDPRVKGILARYSARSRIIYADVLNQATIEVVRQSILKSKGRAYIFCDGGDKLREFGIYQDVLRPDDIIAIHDYGNDPSRIVNNESLLNLTSSSLIEIEPERFRGNAQLPAFRKV